MKEYPFISIVTVNYNGKKYLRNCFDYLYNLNYPSQRFEIIMVDNGSCDGSVEFLGQSFPKVNIICNDVNNYCKANNLGIQHAQGEYVATLNNDTQVDKNWLVELIRVIDADETIGGVGSKILFLDGRIQSAGHLKLPNFYWIDRGVTEKDCGQYDRVEEVNSFCGGAALYRKKALEDVGNFDEDFHMYVEDVDIGIRLKNKGWKLLYIPSSIVYHEFHGSSNEARVHFYCERNRLLLLAKHYPQLLGKALFGRGYFTIQKDRDMQASLYNILPDIILKLMKHHDAKIVQEALSALSEELKKISIYESCVLTGKIHNRNNPFLENTLSCYPHYTFLTEARFKSRTFFYLRNVAKKCLKKIFRNQPKIINTLKDLELQFYKKLNLLQQESKGESGCVRKFTGKRGVNVLGYLNAELGVGEGARANIKCLQSAGIEVSLINIISHSSHRKLDYSFQEFADNNFFDINLIHVNANMIPLLYVEKGRNFFKNKYNIGYWTWELSDFPDEWLQSFNYCDEIWVPSSFVLASIAKKSPLPVLKIPYAVSIDSLKDVDRTYFGLKEDDCIFLFMFDFYSYFERKNLLGIVKAFKQAFLPSENARLVIKCCNSSFDPQAMNSLKDAAKGLNIDIMDKYLYRDEVNTLMYLCDSYISLHRSEGFGLTLAEAMYLGKPVIATGYSGNTNFMNINNSYLVRYKLAEIEKDVGPYKKGCVWAEPDIQHAAELMRYVYENREASREIGKIASADIRRELNFNVIGNEIKKRIDYILNGFDGNHKR